MRPHTHFALNIPKVRRLVAIAYPVGYDGLVEIKQTDVYQGFRRLKDVQAKELAAEIIKEGSW